MQQHASLEVLAAGEQAVRMPGYPHDLVLDPIEHVGGQDHLVAAHRGTVQKAQQRGLLAEHVGPELEHLAAVHVAGNAEPADLLNHPLAARGIAAGDLHGNPFH